MKTNYKPLVLTVLVLILSTAPTAHAGFAPDFLGTTPSGPNTAFNYNLIFATIAGEESLDAGTGAVAPGVAGSQDFLTVFDILGFVSATAPAGFTVQTQLVGIAGPFQSPPDSPTLTNVTFRYSGPDITVDTIFTGVNIVSTSGASGLGLYSSQRSDLDGFDAGTKIGETGYTVIPAPIPEPAAATLLSLAAFGLLRRRSRR